MLRHRQESDTTLLKPEAGEEIGDDFEGQL